MNKSLEHRVNRIIGQMEGLKKEFSKDEYDCEYVLQQLKVIVGSVKSLTQAVADEDIEKCLSKNMTKKEQKERIKLILGTAFK